MAVSLPISGIRQWSKWDILFLDTYQQLFMGDMLKFGPPEHVVVSTYQMYSRCVQDSGISMRVTFSRNAKKRKIPQAGIIFGPGDSRIAKLPPTFPFFSLLLYPYDYICSD